MSSNHPLPDPPQEPTTGTSAPQQHRNLDLREGSGVQVGDGGHQVNLYVGVGSPATGSPSRAGAEWAAPVLVGRPPLQADSFQPRPALRESIRAAWSSGNAAVVTQVMAGDGGTGKTQLAAAEFTQSLREGTRLALWVTASTREGVLAAYAEAYSTTHPQRGTDHDAAEQAEAFLRWLPVTDIPWIIVLDDVADPADLHDLWPAGPTGRIIITTRRRDAALAARGHVINVGVFSPDESLTYLTAKLRAVPGLPSQVLDNAAALANQLGHLPLALAQAAAVILDDALTCEAYRAQFTDTTATLDELFGGWPLKEYGRTIAATWTLATAKADALPPKASPNRYWPWLPSLTPTASLNRSSAPLPHANTSRALSPAEPGQYLRPTPHVQTPA